MKKQVYFYFVMLCIIASLSVSAQKQQGKAKFISSMGFWVVENNKNNPHNNVVYFYNNQEVLVYTEKLDGVKINLNRAKHLRKLKSALEQAVIAWEKGQQNNNMLVHTRFKTGLR